MSEDISNYAQICLDRDLSVFQKKFIAQRKLLYRSWDLMEFLGMRHLSINFV